MEGVISLPKNEGGTDMKFINGHCNDQNRTSFP